MELNRLNDLYRDAILDHCRNPRNQDRLIDSDIVGDAINPFCGDEIHLQLGLDANYRVDCVGLQSVGCSINMAAGSMLTEAIHGKALDEIESLVLLFRQMMRGDVEAERLLKKEGDLSSLAGVRDYPVRIKCALLSVSALIGGIQTFKSTMS